MPVVFPEETWRKLIFIGLPKSGKTTLVRRLKFADGLDPETEPTLGVAIELLEWTDGAGRTTQWLALDCGGQTQFANAIWRPHVEAADGVIFLFDSNDPNSVQETHKWLLTVLEWISENPKTGTDTPLLFIANKSDLETSLTLKNVISELKLAELIKRSSFGVYQCSALKGDNVYEAFEWFFDRLSRYD
ncbi:MAG: ADP-ribosylation factor-like protein [Candidatus Hodarchaeales archaeon]|jgi:small GTP-binding protein